MAYSSDLAILLTAQFTKFTTLNRHQLAGQVANLDFWFDEVRHALLVLDGYGQRFKRLKAAHTKHVREHHTERFALDDPCCIRGSASPPASVPDAELKSTRRALSDATYRFLLRCFRESLIDERRLRDVCETVGISVDAADLSHPARDVR